MASWDELNNANCTEWLLERPDLSIVDYNIILNLPTINPSPLLNRQFG
jgi:hypothetical protein